ncbi:hypothetical protein GCM10009105_22850 [Dokdonella soli]|uniref:Uncharacterized protein n=1 Tax=Dokdonella soli TaxID=529810 RepID=A0ABN1IL57_9GAMM
MGQVLSVNLHGTGGNHNMLARETNNATYVQDVGVTLGVVHDNLSSRDPLHCFGPRVGDDEITDCDRWLHAPAWYAVSIEAKKYRFVECRIANGYDDDKP